jgi:hypothetical protein
MALYNNIIIMNNAVTIGAMDFAPNQLVPLAGVPTVGGGVVVVDAVGDSVGRDKPLVSLRVTNRKNNIFIMHG